MQHLKTQSPLPLVSKIHTVSDTSTVEPVRLTRRSGRAKYEPQWVAFDLQRTHPKLTCPQYGLQAAFSTIERLHHSVTKAGNPIEMDLKTRYVVKGLNKEQTIESKILIAYDSTSGKITKVQDKWDGKLPDSSFKDVSLT